MPPDSGKITPPNVEDKSTVPGCYMKIVGRILP